MYKLLYFHATKDASKAYIYITNEVLVFLKNYITNLEVGISKLIVYNTDKLI